jgi:hypothetical protein
VGIATCNVNDLVKHLQDNPVEKGIETIKKNSLCQM